jgi:hypothetical protein
VCVYFFFCPFSKFRLKEEKESTDREEREKEMDDTVHDSVEFRGSGYSLEIILVFTPSGHPLEKEILESRYNKG